MTRNQRDAAPKRQGGKAPAKGAEGGETLAAAQVVGYLKSHPDFLVRHPELAEVLAPPGRDQGDGGDGIVDLQRYMVERLRGEVAAMAESRDKLVTVGRTNLAAQARVHQAVLALLEARSFEHLIETATTDLAVMLDLDAVAVGVEQATEDMPPVRLGGIFQLEPGTVDAEIGPGRAIMLREDIDGDPAVFGAAAGLIRSEALIRLEISRKTPPALLALGSRKAEQFHPGQGTELMSFLAQALALSIRAWLNLPD